MMYCKSCGAQNDEKSQFCESCGASLGLTASVAGTDTESPKQQVITQPGMSCAKIGIIFGVIGIILSFIFLFVGYIPAILTIPGIFLSGLIAVILGYIGYKKGDEKSGKGAMILGAAVILLFVLTSVLVVLINPEIILPT